jgi:hypothetical protein
VSSAPLRRDDGCEPLDPDRSVAYRFGGVKWTDQWDPPVRSRFYFFPPCETFSGPARSGSVQNRPSLFRIGPLRFYLFSRPFELIQITFRYVFQTLIPRDLEIHL